MQPSFRLDGRLDGCGGRQAQPALGELEQLARLVVARGVRQLILGLVDLSRTRADHVVRSLQHLIGLAIQAEGEQRLHQHQPDLLVPFLDRAVVDAAVILTSGSDMPPETQTYLDSRSDDPTIIAIGVVYNNARISLAERARELASLRVLGFRRSEISYIFLGELAVVTAPSPDPAHHNRPTVRVIYDEMGLPLDVPRSLDLTEVDPSSGRPVRAIIKTTDPEKYGIHVRDYFV